MTEFQKLTDQIVDYLLAENPTWATYAGVHDYDSALPSLAADRIAAKQQKLSEYRAQLKQADPARLTEIERIDRQVLSGMLAEELVDLEEHQTWKRNPYTPLSIASFGAMMLVTRDFAPLPERLNSLCRRLEAVPGLLSEAQQNISAAGAIPTVWAEMAEQGCKDIVRYFGETLIQLGDSAPTMAEELRKAGNTAATACNDYLKFLEEEVTDRTKGSYALGESGFARLLKESHGLTQSYTEIAQFGMDAVAEITARMDELAEEITPGAGRRQVLDDIKTTAAAGDDVLSAYREEVKRTRAFVVEKQLVSIPPEDNLEVVDTPEFNRSTLPFAAYLPPAAFAEKSQAGFWVTPIDKSAPDEMQQQQRRGHNRYSMMLIALHEGYPGHHVQHLHGAHAPSRVCKLATSTLFAEGWALYCEQLMAEEGYYSEPEARLMQLAHELWRACRVVIDVGLHTEQMTFSQAVTLLVEVAGADPVNAIAEIKRYTYTPTQPQSYLVGKRELLALRDEVEARLGDEFSLRRFHDRLLSFGRIPFACLREPLLEQI